MNNDRQSGQVNGSNIRIAADVWARKRIEQVLELPAGSLPPQSSREPSKVDWEGVMRRVRHTPEWRALKEGAALKHRCRLEATSQLKLLRLLESSGVRRRGHVRFVQGCRIGVYHEFGRFREKKGELAALAGFWRDGFARLVAEKQVDKVVAHGSVMEEVAKQTFVRGTSRRESDVILAVGSRAPVVVALRSELAGRRVALFLDVVLSGSTVRRLRRLLFDTYGVSEVHVFCVVLSKSYSLRVSEISCLYLDAAEKRYLTSCQACDEGDVPWIYDSNFGITCELNPEQQHDAWKEHFHVNEEWWRWIRDTGALEFDRRLGPVVVKYFVNFTPLLADPGIRLAIGQRAREKVLEIAGSRDCVIVSPKQNKQSRIVAQCVAEHVGCESFKVRRRDGAVYLSKSDVEKIGKRPVVFVDAAVDGGATLQGVAGALVSAGVRLAGVFVVVDRMLDATRRELEGSIGGFEIVSLLRFPFRSVEVKPGDQPASNMFEACLEDLCGRGRLAPYVDVVRGRPGGGRKQAIDPVSESAKREAVECAVDARATGRGHRYFHGVTSKRDLWTRLRGLPPELKGNPAINLVLCAFAHNGLSWDLKKRTVKELINLDCYDWVPGWLRANRETIRDQIPFVAVALAIGIMRVPDYQERVLDEIRELIAEMRRTCLPFDERELATCDATLAAFLELERVVA